MVLKLPSKAGQALDLQKDVRETAGISGTPTIGDFTNSGHNHSNATGGGQLDHTSSFSAGAGTNTHAQIDTAVSNSTTHIASSGSDHSEVSTNSTHVAGDGSDHADVATNTSHSGGNGADHANVATNTTDIAALQGAQVSSIVAGDGIDVSGATGDVTVSGEDSTAGNKGIVIIAGGDGISVSYASGTATVTNTVSGGTSYLTIPGCGFIPIEPDVDDITYARTGGYVTTNGTGIAYVTPVNLPHGAVVTGIIVYGNDTGQQFTLTRAEIADGANSADLGSAFLNSADTSISNATVDNANYFYWIYTTTLDAADIIYSAKITYTI